MPAPTPLHRLVLSLSLAGVALAGFGCGSTAQKGTPRSDAGSTTDMAIPDTRAAGPGDAAERGLDSSKPDSRLPDLAAARPDADTVVPVDATLVSRDTAAPKRDTALPDLSAQDTRTPRTDTRLPDATPSPKDAQPAEAGFHCPEDAGPAVLGHLTPLELKTLLDGDEDPFLINVKGASIDNIPGTDAVLVNDVPGIEALVGGDLCANIILYCRSGNTSQSVATQLLAKGYRRIRDLTGGITAWQAAGYPTL